MKVKLRRGKGCRSCLVQYVAWGNFQKAKIAISCERDYLKGWKVRQLQSLFWAPVNLVPTEDICYFISFLSKLLNSRTKAFVFICSYFVVVQETSQEDGKNKGLSGSSKGVVFLRSLN